MSKSNLAVLEHHRTREPRHIVIPDCQVKPDIKITHLTALGNYIAEWRPSAIINIGDFYDMTSLCAYENDLAASTQRHIERDIAAGDAAWHEFTKPWLGKTLGGKKYEPRMLYTLGNHEWRWRRLMDEQPNLRGAIREPWGLALKQGWQVAPYLKPVTVDGVTYAHLFVKGANGRVTNAKFGAANARTQVLREMRSCTAGHKPGLDVHIQPIGSGSMRGIIAGSFYQHDEEYMTPQGTTYWRGVLVKHGVKHGNYDLMEVRLSYLLRKYT